jgi:hypothetical protein
VVTAAVDAPAQIRAALPLARENAYAAGLLQRASGRLQRDPSQLEAAVTTWETIGARFERACTLTLLPTRREEGARELAQLGCPMPATAN